MELPESPKFSDLLPKKEILEEKLFIEFKNNKLKFIEWFKENYKEVYVQIF